LGIDKPDAAPVSTLKKGAKAKVNWIKNEGPV
jgi:hypothetical protein